MKKTIILFLFLILFFSGCSLTVKNDNSSISEQKVYSNLYEWLSSGEEVGCTVDLIDRRVVVRAKNNKVRLDNVSVPISKFDEKALTQGSMLTIDERWAYMWSGREGLRLDIKTYKDQSDYPDDTAISSWQNIVNDWVTANFTYKCERTKISDLLFVPPEDVSFSELR